MLQHLPIILTGFFSIAVRRLSFPSSPTEAISCSKVDNAVQEA